jgi:thiol-disulfide isomerase/thioredoxin
MSVEGVIRSVAHRLAGDTPALPDEGRLASFERATGWLNSTPLTAADLAGRVVLVDFWTYTCVNWLRTLPYLRAWHTKYSSAGLTIVGVHTPEFDFETDPVNVELHTRELGVEFPVAIDADYGVWGDFANHYWPAVYLADANGRIRYHHFGEGDYAMTEMAIQQLLVGAGAKDVDLSLVDPEFTGIEVAADWNTLRSPETYLGYGQSSGFVSEIRSNFDRAHLYRGSDNLRLNSWDLTGEWTVTQRAAILNEPGGRIAFAFQARDVNLVMTPGTAPAPIPFRLFLDGRPVGEGVVDTAGTYQLVRQTGEITERVFEIEFLERGVAAYCFTFG